MSTPDVILVAIADALDAASTTLRQRAALLRLGSPVPDTGHTQPQDAVARARAIHPALGPRQIEVIQFLEEAGCSGASTGAIALAIDYDQPNVHLTLQALTTYGIVEKDTSTRPHTYRLRAKFLGSAVWSVNVDVEIPNLSGESPTDCREPGHQGAGRHFDITIHPPECPCTFQAARPNRYTRAFNTSADALAFAQSTAATLGPGQALPVLVRNCQR